MLLEFLHFQVEKIITRENKTVQICLKSVPFAHIKSTPTPVSTLFTLSISEDHRTSYEYQNLTDSIHVAQNVPMSTV